MKRQVEVPVLSTEIRMAYTEIDIPEGLTEEQEQEFALAAYYQDRQNWESEYVIDVDERPVDNHGLPFYIRGSYRIIVHPAQENE